MKINYQKMLDEKLCELERENRRPSLLLHACCAPCSTYVLEYLSGYFDITVYFYNPNIYPESEYFFRADELSRFVEDCYKNKAINVVCENYNSSEFYEAVKGRESDSEGGDRCRLCYELRLARSAEYAAANGFDYFTTTLSISPHKNAEWLNDIGKKCAEKNNIEYLCSDFKKKNGYKRSCEITNEYGMYRQNYCGCVFSMRDALAKNQCDEKFNN